MQRYCDGCQRHHDLVAFDLDKNSANAVCRAYARKQARGARRKQQSKIEALEQRRRGLIAALVQIDQEIDRERALQVAPSALFSPGDAEDIFGTDSDLKTGD